MSTNRFVSTLGAVVAVVVVHGATAATPTVRPPARWVGTVNYGYEQASNGVLQRARITATVTLGHATSGYRARDPWSYVSRGGTIRWTASGSRPNCTWTSTGSRKIGKNDLFLELSRSGASPRFRAAFAAPNELLVEATQTCTYSSGPETTQTEYDVGHPFALLGDITAGVPVDDRLTTIRGSKPGSQNIGSNHTLRWAFNWSFRSRR
jgi:hypothetical protein